MSIRTSFNSFGTPPHIQLRILLNRIRKTTGNPNTDIVEFIESHGSQYIDTGIFFSHGMRTVFEMQRTTDTNDEAFFGTWQDDPARVIYHVTAYNGQYWFGGNDGWNELHYGTVDKQKHVFDYSDKSLSVDGVVLASDLKWGRTTTPIYVFARYRFSAAEHFTRSKCWMFKIFTPESAEAINLVPVKIGNTNAMFDIVTGTVFYNKYLNAFTVGPIVKSIDQLTAAQKEAWFGR